MRRKSLCKALITCLKSRNSGSRSMKCPLTGVPPPHSFSAATDLFNNGYRSADDIATMLIGNYVGLWGRQG